MSSEQIVIENVGSGVLSEGALAGNDRLEQIKMDIREQVNRAEGAVITIASRLYEIEYKKLYTLAGFSGTAKFAEEEFGLAKSTVSECLKVMKQFANKESFELPDNLRDFGISKLVKLADCPPTLIKLMEVTPTMTRQQIIDRKKEFDEMRKVASAPNDIGYDFGAVAKATYQNATDGVLGLSFTELSTIFKDYNDKLKQKYEESKKEKQDTCSSDEQQEKKDTSSQGEQQEKKDTSSQGEQQESKSNASTAKEEKKEGSPATDKDKSKAVEDALKKAMSEKDGKLTIFISKAGADNVPEMVARLIHRFDNGTCKEIIIK